MGTQLFRGYLSLGGARRDRTADLLHAMQALSQLSYSPLDSGPESKRVSFDIEVRILIMERR